MMLNGFKRRLERLEQHQPNQGVSAEMVARVERAQERAGLGLPTELTDERRAELRGKDIGAMILLFRKWASEAE